MPPVTKKIKITLSEEMLGTACANKDVHKEFIAAKSADADKAAEELASLPAEELEGKAKTVFHRDEDGTPFLYDYQIKGFLKEAVGVQCELMTEEIKVGKSKLTKYSHKKIVDNFLFVTPRKIRLSQGVGADCVRPLRAETMRGERVSLATSETVPIGTELEFEITDLTGSKAFGEIVDACLEYGRWKGLGQWRNSGKGRFTFTKAE